MALTDEKITELARSLGKHVYVQANKTALADVVALKAVIHRIDQIFAATTDQIAALRPGEPLQTMLKNEIRATAPAFSNQDAGIALVIWVADAANLGDIL